MMTVESALEPIKLNSRVNSKNKGNTFERKIANLFSKRFATVTGITNSFRRNPDSGSFFGATNQKKLTTHALDKACFGDIICPPEFRYSLECKHYKIIPNFFGLINSDIKDWDKWIIQAKQDCMNSNKQMAIIVKYNNMKEIVILDTLIGFIDCSIRYKSCYVLPLEAFMASPDHLFFES